MGCGCKAKQQVTFLEKKYGTNMPQSKLTNITGKLFGAIKKILLTIILIPIVPAVAIFFIFKNVVFKKKKPINISETFKIAN